MHQRCFLLDGWNYHPKHVELTETINKIITVASSWLFILLYQRSTVTQTSEVKYFISAHRNRTTNVMCWNRKLRWRITCLLVHILILSRPVSLHHSHFNARFHAHATQNVLRHWCRIQDCWKHCIMKLVVNLCISHRFWSKTKHLHIKLSHDTFNT